MIELADNVLRLPSNPRNICIVERYVKLLASRYNITEAKYPNILISLTEAVTNAIFHGNNCDSEKYVCLYLKKEKNTLVIKVCDEGKGFDPASLPDPTAPENICKDGGRGVFLIKELTDRVIFQDKGKTVELHFNL